MNKKKTLNERNKRKTWNKDSQYERRIKGGHSLRGGGVSLSLNALYNVLK